MVVAVCALLFAGYPVALTLGGVSFAFAASAHLAGAMDIGLLYALPQRMFGVMTNTVLLAIPLFIFMGVMLERSRIAEDLLETMGRLFGSLPGGLGISVVLVGVLLAAAKGVVGATVVTIALITLPTMLRHGYDKRLAAGTVAATATLAQILPPATVLVLLGDQLNNSFQAAQLAKGNFAPDSVSVSDLFAGAIVPGLTLVALYLAFIIASGDPPARRRAADPRRRAGRGRIRPRAEGAGRAGSIDHRGARLDPDRACDPDRSRGRRRGRRGAARGVAQRARARCGRALHRRVRRADDPARVARPARWHRLRTRADRDGGARARAFACAARSASRRLSRADRSPRPRRRPR